MTREEALNYAIVKVLSLEHGRELVGDECKSKFQDELDFYHAVIRNLCPITREQVEKMKGEWIKEDPPVEFYICSKCGESAVATSDHGYHYRSAFCPHCGTPMTDEAVEMMTKRLEEMQND